MTINAAKKIGLFLSILVIDISAAEMIENVKKRVSDLRSAVVRSDKTPLVLAITVPVVLAGSYLIAKNKDDISEYTSKIFENVEKNAVISGIAIPITGLGVYGGMQYAITPEMKLQAHNDWLEKEKETNVLLQQQKEIQKIFDGQQEDVQKQAHLEKIVDMHFSTKAHNEYPIRTAIKSCNKLEEKLQKGKELQKKISSRSSDSDGLTKNDEAILFVKRFKAALVNLPGYKDAMHKASGEKQNKLAKDQFTWTNKYSSFISALTALFTPAGTVLALWLQSYLFPQ